MRTVAASFLFTCAFGVIISFGFVTSAFADGTCIVPGTRPATAADVTLMQAAGITGAVVGMCWNPTDANVGSTDAQAKQDLQSMWCGSSAAQCTYNGSTYTSTIDGLDPKFALCADKFMKQLRQVSPSACINSAYRSTAQQACACARTCPDHSPNGCSGLCAPPGNSYHQKGLAIDVGRVSVPKQQFWGIAQQSGIGNPTGLHSSDPYHIQVMNGGITCSDAGYMPTDTDVFVPGPANTNPYFSYAPSPMPSLPPLPMTMTPAPAPLPAQTSFPTQTPPVQNSIPSQIQLCVPQFTCAAGVTYYHTSACTTQVYEVCQYGCAGNACATKSPAATSTQPHPASTSTTVGTTTGATNTNTNSNDNTNGNSTGPSVSDLINAMAHPVSFTTTDVGTPSAVAFSLNPDTTDVGQIDSSQQTATSTLAPGTIASVQPVLAQQTFTSNDLSSGFSGQQFVPQQNFSVQAILSNLQSALVWALNVLKSLGGGHTAQATQ